MQTKAKQVLGLEASGDESGNKKPPLSGIKHK